jgi:hypothetical protein
VSERRAEVTNTTPGCPAHLAVHALRAGLGAASKEVLLANASALMLVRASSRECGLTLPSRGRLTAGFAVCKPPLMSNVRELASARKRRPRSSWAARAAAGEPVVARNESGLRHWAGLSIPAGGQRTAGAAPATANPALYIVRHRRARVVAFERARTGNAVRPGVHFELSVSEPLRMHGRAAQCRKSGFESARTLWRSPSTTAEVIFHPAP